MYRRLLLVISLLGVGTAFCSGRQGKAVMHPEDRLALADQLRAEGKCSKAVVEYEQLLSEFPSQRVAERAEFGLGTCRTELEEYDLAVHGFEDFIDSYPKSDLLDDAIYMIALIYIRQAPRPERDQTNTVKALSELNLLLREYPDTDLREEAELRIAECRSKLAEKDYLNGALYLKMGQRDAARLYFDSVLEAYGDTPWAARALLGKGIAYEDEGRLEEARKAYEQVLRDQPAGDAGEEARRRLRDLRGAVDSGTQASSEE